MAAEQPRTLSVLVPELALPLDELHKLRIQHISKLYNAAKAELPAEKLIIRDLQPTDVGLAQDDWRMTTGATARAWEASSISAKVIADNRFVAIFGVADISDAQAIGGLKVESQQSTVAEWGLDSLWADEQKRAIALAPVIVKQNLVLTVRWYVKFPNAPVELVLIGAVCEKEGLVLKI